MAVLLLDLPVHAEARLAALAHADGCSVGDYACKLILEHLEDLEDIYLAEKTLEQVRRGEMATHRLDDVAW